MIDLRLYGPKALTNRVYADPYFYNETDPAFIQALASEEFRATEKQRGNLKQALATGSMPGGLNNPR